MGKLLGIIGPSGSGKSTSIGEIPELGIKGLDPKETALINVSKKPLPFRGASKKFAGSISKGGNYAEVDRGGDIADVIKYVDKNRSDVHVLVVDDSGYSMSFDIMRNINEKGYDKWTRLASDMFSAVEAARQARNDLIVVFIFHQEKGDDGIVKIKTGGKLLDNAVYLDGLFTIILQAQSRANFSTNTTEYYFLTQSRDSTAKAPVGMFESAEIPNDLGYVVDKINQYYE